MIENVSLKLFLLDEDDRNEGCKNFITAKSATFMFKFLSQ